MLSKEEWIVISHRKSWKKFLASVLVVLPSFFDKLFAINQFFSTMLWLSMKYKKVLDNRCYLKIKRYNFCHKEGLLQTHRLRIFKIKRSTFLLVVNIKVLIKFVDWRTSKYTSMFFLWMLFLIVLKRVKPAHST